mmetsp:Transcript_2918/g.4412  ORF Transcript_2918/g.4412 Transcript_2918/m.4412 type:complete len:82 (+) Transcript_2918:93-338(+)
MFKSVIVAALVASAAAFAPAPATFGVRTALSAESEWTPTDGTIWKETNYEIELNKLEKEAEARLDAKIKELEGNIASVGKP